MRKIMLLPIALLLAAAGPTQPQTVEGACRVKQFFIVSLGTSHTTMAIAPGGTCRFTVINPALQVFQTSALVTDPPHHGKAVAGLLQSGVTALIEYTPTPGYTGPDRFTATIQPRDKAVIVTVEVGPLK